MQYISLQSHVMKATCLLVALIYYTLGLIAQSKPTVTVRAGKKMRDGFTTAQAFYYPEFKTGQVFFRNGNKAEAKLNYSQLVDEIHFIDQKGDTLALTNENDIRFISIGSDSFYYDQGYVRLVSGNNVIKLGHKALWTLDERIKIGAYNMQNPASSIHSYSSFNDRGKFFELSPNEDIVLEKKDYYYFGDKYNQFVVAGRKNLLMLFPKQQRRIDAYLKEHKIDFTNKDHLENVLRFMEELDVR